MDFLYVKVPVPAGAAPRGARRATVRDDGRHDALHARLESALQAAGAGSLVGWGPSMETASGPGRERVAFHRIDVELDALDARLPLLRTALVEAGVPAGTELHYGRAGRPLVESLGPGGWRTATG